MRIEVRDRSNGPLLRDLYDLLRDTLSVFTQGPVNLAGWDYLNFHIDCALRYPANGKPAFWKLTLEPGTNGFEAWAFGRYYLVCRLDRMYVHKDRA